MNIKFGSNFISDIIKSSLGYIQSMIYTNRGESNFVNYIKTIERRELIIILNWIGKIRKDEKIGVKKMEILPDNISTKFYRTFIETESREDTTTFCHHIATRAIELLDIEFVRFCKAKSGSHGDLNKKEKGSKLLRYQLAIFLNAISSFVGGLNNIKTGVYKDDRMFNCYIQSLIDDVIKCKFLEIEVECPDLIQECSDMKNIAGDELEDLENDEEFYDSNEINDVSEKGGEDKIKNSKIEEKGCDEKGDVKSGEVKGDVKIVENKNDNSQNETQKEPQNETQNDSY